MTILKAQAKISYSTVKCNRIFLKERNTIVLLCVCTYNEEMLILCDEHFFNTQI